APEISIRLSVGASRSRLVRQLLTESAMLAGLGTAAGLGVSVVGARLLLAATDAPWFLQPHLDLRVLLFAFGMAGLTAALFGLTPALRAASPTAARSRARGILVAAQVAAGCTLLVVAALFVRAIQHLAHTPLGFDYTEHVVVDPSLHANGFTPAAAREYWAQLRDRLTVIPAVAGVALD